MITRGLSCDRVGFWPFWGGSDDPPDPPLATGLQCLRLVKRKRGVIEIHEGKFKMHSIK